MLCIMFLLVFMSLSLSLFILLFSIVFCVKQLLDCSLVVRNIPLGGACDSASSCADVNAACNSGLCRCVAPHYQKNQACGSHSSLSIYLSLFLSLSLSCRFLVSVFVVIIRGDSVHCVQGVSIIIFHTFCWKLDNLPAVKKVQESVMMSCVGVG